MVKAKVVVLSFLPTRGPSSERQYSKDRWDRGLFYFAQVPATGDRFTIRETTGAEDDVRVLYIEHEPTREGEARSQPHVTVVAEWLTGRAG